MTETVAPTFFDLDAIPHHATPKEKFEAFHTENPHVLEAMETMIQELVDRGRTRVSLKMCAEVLRWQYYLRTADPNSEFKINNNYVSRYARLIISRHPEWDGLFQLRTVHDTKGFLVRKKS